MFSQEVFLYERGGDDPKFAAFLTENAEDILNIFDQMYIDNNYFSMREGLKTSYMLMANPKNEGIRKYYISDKKRIKAIMNTVLNQNKAI